MPAGEKNRCASGVIGSRHKAGFTRPVPRLRSVGVQAHRQCCGGAPSRCGRNLDVAAVGPGHLRGLGQAQARTLVVALLRGVERRHGVLQHLRGHAATLVSDDNTDTVSVGLD